MKIIDSYSGKRKFLKGRGRKGRFTLDEYQLMLIEGEKTNGFENELKQRPLTRFEQKARGFKRIK
jgi:hypothetical protein